MQEPFVTLSLALKAKTLEQCLDEFFKDEKVKDYRCEKCKQNAILKKTSLY
jgi:ubiquitin carboxyl-terminal hydrolase 8